MGMHLEEQEHRVEVEAAKNAGFIAATKKINYGEDVGHTFTDVELIEAWKRGYQKAMSEKKESLHITLPTPDELGRIEE